jgi:hypothetical protein
MNFFGKSEKIVNGNSIKILVDFSENQSVEKKLKGILILKIQYVDFCQSNLMQHYYFQLITMAVKTKEAILEFHLLR